MRYDHKKQDTRWQQKWKTENAYRADENSSKAKYYCLIEFPYPSSEGLHTGHVRGYTGMDIIARKRRGEGYNVLYPIGWDAFGLPTENFAIKTGIHPAVVTKKNTDNFRRQLQAVGLSFDWSREINTTDPGYYKWTQWIFLQFFRKGLAYKKKIPINWCLSCNIVLANEEVVEGRCERCGGKIEKREKEQWLLAITKYASRLEKDLDKVDYLEKIKIQQKNWIGRSEGSEIDFPLKEKKGSIPIFTTRADTLYGATYVVLAPEHQMVAKLKSEITNWKIVHEYVEQAQKKTEFDRTNKKREKTGIELKGVMVVNPVSKKEIPIFVADYVLAYYGTGAIMAVPAHDKRDFEFAKKYNIPIIPVIKPHTDDSEFAFSVVSGRTCYEGEGSLFNSEGFNDMTSKEAHGAITKRTGGKQVTTYQLRDWVFSRQRYWGEPIPLIFCENCAQKIKRQKTKSKIKENAFNKGELLNPGWIAAPEKELPIILPDVKNYKPTDTVESPLAHVTSWVNTTCPECKGPARRETDTMPNWAGSSWYFLRYTDVYNKKALAARKNLDYWMPVDWYNGGMEHTTLHLLYSRFWYKFLYDIGVVPTDEPYHRRTSHGMVLMRGEKMSKSRGNVVNPDDVIKEYGADTLRLYGMFMGPFDQAISWNSEDIVGVKRFLDKLYDFVENYIEVYKRKQPKGKGNDKIKILLHETIQKVSNDIEHMSFNTAIAQLMIFLNKMREGQLNRHKEETTVNHLPIDENDLSAYLKLVSPFAPHITEELWHMLGKTASIHKEPWPKTQRRYLKKDTVTVVVQIDGRLRDRLTIPPRMGKDAVFEKARKELQVAKWLKGHTVERVIYIEDKVLNIVTK